MKPLTCSKNDDCDDSIYCIRRIKDTIPSVVSILPGQDKSIKRESRGTPLFLVS